MEEHLSDWHVFTPSDRRTYPKVDAPVQVVRFSDGGLRAGSSSTFFHRMELLRHIVNHRVAIN